jgi:tetratricopeptide (TPR) repeat protein
MKKYKYSKDPDEYYQNGLQKYEYKDFTGAVSDFTLAIKFKKNFPEAYFLRGLVYGKEMHKYGKAIKDFTKAIKLKPDYAEAYFNRGVTHRILDDIKRACSDWKKAEKMGFTSAADLIQRYCLKYIKN